MRKCILFLLCGCFVGFSCAQSLENYRIWYPDSRGAGRINSIELTGGAYIVEKEYDATFITEGYRPSSMIVGNDGFIYGTLDNGTIFKMNQDGSVYEIIHSLPGFVDGNGLLHGQDGRLYGMTTFGHIYRTNPSEFSAEVIYQFDNPENGRFPIGSLVQDGDGILYGICRAGGEGSIFPPGPGPNSPYQAGVLFKINTDGSDFQKLFDFTYAQGYTPSSLIIGSNGELFGTTLFGGAFNRGVLFTIGSDGTGYSILSDFSSVSPNPRGPLIEHNAKLYGLTQNNAVYSIDLDGNNHLSLRNFIQGVPNEGTKPVELVLSGGEFYGINSFGGVNGLGTIFKMDLNGNNYEDIYQFDGTNGNPQKNASFDQGRQIIVNTSGDLIIAISGGAVSNNGILFKLNTSLDQTIIKDYSVDSSYPANIFATNNKLVGLNTEFGELGSGGVFSFEVTGDNYTELSNNEENDYAQVVSDDQGNLFGFDYDNRIIKYNASLNQRTVLYHADVVTEGSIYSILLVGDQIYGNTDLVFFKIGQDGSNFTVLAEFDPVDNFNPPNTLAHHDGYLYGVTQFDGSFGKGTIYRIKTDGSEFEVLLDLDEYSISSQGQFIIASNSKIYGLVYSNDNYPKGALYCVNLNGSQFNIVLDMNLHLDIGEGIASFSEWVDGWIVGKTLSGAAYDLGALFRIKLDGTELTKIADNDEGGYFFTVAEKEENTIEFAAIESRVLGSENVTLTATASNMLPVIFEADDDEKVIIAGSSLTMLKAGRVVISVKGSDPHFKPGSQSSSFCIFPPKPSINVTGEGLLTPVLTSSNVEGNQWYLNGELISSATSAMLTVTQQGIYTVRTTVDDCPSELSDGISGLITGINNERYSIKMYPNPVKDELIIDMGTILIPNSIQLIDPSGRELLLNQQVENTKVKMNTSTLSRGIYLLKIESEGKTQIFKIIK